MAQGLTALAAVPSVASMIGRRLCLLLALCALPATGLPASALPEGFVYLEALAPTILQDMRYHGRENFLGQRVDGYAAPRCILTRAAAEALARVQAELLPQQLSLKVFDCYRPQRAVAHFMRWARAPDDPALRAHYHPNLGKPQLLREVYIAERSGHSRGSTVDVTLVPVTPTLALPHRGGGKDSMSAPHHRGEGKDSMSGHPYQGSGPDSIGSLPHQGGGDDAISPVPRERGRASAGATGHDGCGPEAARRGGALDMGSGFDCFDPVSNTDSLAITPAQHANRQRLKRMMERQGFRNYAREWWHYTLAREPFTQQYFDFPVR